MKRAFLAVLILITSLIVVAVVVFYWWPLWVNDQIIRTHLWRQHVHSKYVTVDGYRVHYFEAEPKPGLRKYEGDKVLVLVHGLGSRGEDWSPMIPTLAAQGFHVYVPDLLGYGRSPQPDVNYSIPLQEKTVVDFMSALGIMHADVGGWSMGGWIALKLTVDHPELVDRLVVYDAAGLYFPPTFEASLFVPRDSSEMARLQAMLTPVPKPLPAFVERAAIRKLKDNAWVIERGVDAMEAGRDLLDFQLDRIHKPVLIVWGKQDMLIPLAVGEEMHRKISDSNMLVVDGCGHLAPGECSKPILKGTVDFLKAQPALQGEQLEVAGK